MKLKIGKIKGEGRKWTNSSKKREITIISNEMGWYLQRHYRHQYDIKGTI